MSYYSDEEDIGDAYYGGGYADDIVPSWLGGGESGSVAAGAGGGLSGNAGPLGGSGSGSVAAGAGSGLTGGAGKLDVPSSVPGASSGPLPNVPGPLANVAEKTGGWWWLLLALAAGGGLYLASRPRKKGRR